jgi:hypothetical protein
VGATIHYFRARYPEAAIIGHEVLQSFARMRDVAAVVGEYHPAIHGHRFEELEGVFDGFDLDPRRNRTGVRHFRAVRR